MIKREVRERVFAKYNEHCAFCGKALDWGWCEWLILLNANKKEK